MLDQRGGAAGRLRWTERVCTIGSGDDQIHFRAQVDKISRALATLFPKKASSIVERDRREKRDARRNVADAEPDLGDRRQKILLRIAPAHTGRGKHRSS